MTVGWLVLLLALLLGVVVVLVVTPGLPGVRVLNRSRADGVHPKLRALLDEWEQFGTHTVMVAPDGGLRTDAAKQAGYAAAGNSNATTLASTPHGRGAALDIYPVDFLPFIAMRWENVPASVRAKFRTFGEFAEARGFTWGGRWTGATFPNGDQPHVEITGWRSLPYPPPTGGYV